MGARSSKVAADSVDQVSTIITTRTPEALQWQDATKLFQEIDANNDGRISTAELVNVLTAHGYAAEEVAAKLMAELDTDGDGEITFDEWRKGFYSSSFVHIKQPAGEDFADLYLADERGGFTIELTAERGIIIGQLSRVRKHITRECKLQDNTLSEDEEDEEDEDELGDFIDTDRGPY